FVVGGEAVGVYTVRSRRRGFVGDVAERRVEHERVGNDGRIRVERRLPCAKAKLAHDSSAVSETCSVPGLTHCACIDLPQCTNPLFGVGALPNRMTSQDESGEVHQPAPTSWSQHFS